MSYLRRRWIVPAANISSCRTSTMRPLISPACSANSSGVPRPRSITSAVSPSFARGDRAHQRMARGHRAVGQAQGRASSPASRCRARGSSGPELAGDAARTRSRSRAKAFFSLSVPASRPPESQMSLKSRHSSGSAASRAAAPAAIAGEVAHRGLPSFGVEQFEEGRGEHRRLAVAAMEDADLVDHRRFELAASPGRDELKLCGRQRIDQRPAGAGRDQRAAGWRRTPPRPPR